MIKNVQVVPYNPEWPDQFREEAARLQEALGGNSLEIHHIGSTSILGLAAKPIIDILPEVKEITQVDSCYKAMEALGYKAKGEYGIPFRRYFKKEREGLSWNVHIFEQGSPEIGRHLAFRDWMRTHPKDCEAYAVLKQKLAERFPSDMQGYCMGKESFIQRIDEKAGFQGERFVMALTENQWSAVREFREKYFEILDDPYGKFHRQGDHIHFVFYEGSLVIGYAHIEHKPRGCALLHMLLIDPSFQGKGWGKHLLVLCERWLIHQGYRGLRVIAAAESASFYRHQHYAESLHEEEEFVLEKWFF